MSPLPGTVCVVSQSIKSHKNKMNRLIQFEARISIIYDKYLYIHGDDNGRTNMSYVVNG